MIDIYVRTYKEVTNQIDEASIARFYLSMEVGKFYRSLFRDDTHPSASLYYNSEGKLQYNDFVHHYSLPYAIMNYYGWTLRDLLIRITNDFKLKSVSSDEEYASNKVLLPFGSIVDVNQFAKHTIIQRKLRDFELHDIEYWNQFGISKEWLTHSAVKVNPISHFWIDNNKGRRMFKADKYAYCYDYFYYGDRFLRKIYQPYNLSKGKWISNVAGGVGGVCQLWETLPKQGRELLIVTSSLKDGGTIYCNTFDVLRRNEGIYSIAPNNEGSYLPDQIVPKLKQRFKRIVVWFDNDRGGITSAKKYKELYGWDYIFNPEGYPKDPSDFRMKYGQREFIELFQYLLYGS